MAVVPVVASAETADQLAAALNAALLPLSNARIFGVEIGQARQSQFFSRNLFFAFSYDTSGAAALAQPFQVHVISRATEAQVVLVMNQFIAANPAYFFSNIFVTYRPTDTLNPDLAVSGFIFYNPVGAAAGANWPATSSTVPIGPVGGDLSGSLPNPTVSGIINLPVATGPIPGGAALVYDSGSNSLVWYVEQIYGSLAIAAANQTVQVIGQNIIIAHSPAIPGDGLYQLNVKTGSPTDYTFVSGSSSIASGVALDAPIPPLTAVNVFTALQQIVALVINPSAMGTIPPASSVIIESYPIATVALVEWHAVLQNGSSRYVEELQYTHDGTTPFGTSYGITGTNFPFGATLSVTISGGNINLVLTTTSFACDYRVITTTLPV